MLTFSPEAIEALNRFARLQSADLIRVAIEKDGCAPAEFVVYLSERLPDDAFYPFADCVVAIDPKTLQFLGSGTVDLSPDGGLCMMLPTRIETGCTHPEPIRSTGSTSSVPPPMQLPSMSATVGKGSRLIRVKRA